ncbi:MAG: fumarylacetoacetate hydrolase family protein [Campylobacterales bacterium]|nr:fumarylacetoacetate hydrolase family protein [Campylobacterales bacterium]
MTTLTCNTHPFTPSKVVCIGRNYVEHIHELGNEIPQSMVVFNKPNSAITDTLRRFSPDTRFEGEICFMIQGGAIAAVGFGLDLTHADIQNGLKAKGLPWERAKAFDGSAVLGEFVPYSGDISALRFVLRIDGVVRQEASVDLMIYKPHVMLREIGSFMSLEDGDIIMSGTPKGVGTYAKGELFEGSVYAGETLLVSSSWRVC